MPDVKVSPLDPDYEPVKVPRNKLVTKLAAEILKNPRRERIDIALELVDSDRAKAESLLRQLRRFPHLLESDPTGQ